MEWNKENPRCIKQNSGDEKVDCVNEDSLKACFIPSIRIQFTSLQKHIQDLDKSDSKWGFGYFEKLIMFVNL